MVKVEGIIFRIKRLDPIAYLNGSNVIFQMYQTYEEKRIAGKNKDEDFQKMKSHYCNVFLESVVEPKLSREKTENKDEIFVENLMKNWDLANGLYEKIIEYTYGKKNPKFSISQNRSSESST